jgi:hypothetical protein
MEIANIHEAKSQLSKLIDHAMSVSVRPNHPWRPW